MVENVNATPDAAADKQEEYDVGPSSDPGAEAQVDSPSPEEVEEALAPDVLPKEESSDEWQPDIAELLIAEAVSEPAPAADPRVLLKAVIEAAIYITDNPLSAETIAIAVEQPLDTVQSILGELRDEYASPARGVAIREIAGGYKMATKPEHHEAIRRFVAKLQPPLKLSMAALETLAVVAYKQPITGPEILDVRGVQGAGVLKTLLDRKLIAAAGRKNVLGKPILYKTTREFLVQFGLNSLAELPTLKEFEELGRMALLDEGELGSQPDNAQLTLPPAAAFETPEETLTGNDFAAPEFDGAASVLLEPDEEHA